MLDMQPYMTHDIKVERETDVLVVGATINDAHSVNFTFSTAVQFEVYNEGGGTVGLIGSNDDGLTSSAIDFDATTRTEVITTQVFTALTLYTLDPTSTNVRIRSIYQSGQPYLQRSVVYSSLKARLDSTPTFRVGLGVLAPVLPGQTAKDRVIGFTTEAEGSILQRDIITDLSNSTEYEVVDTNVFYRNDRYSHTELSLARR